MDNKIECDICKEKFPEKDVDTDIRKIKDIWVCWSCEERANKING